MTNSHQQNRPKLFHWPAFRLALFVHEVPLQENVKITAWLLVCCKSREDISVRCQPRQEYSPIFSLYKIKRVQYAVSGSNSRGEKASIIMMEAARERKWLEKGNHEAREHTRTSSRPKKWRRFDRYPPIFADSFRIGELALNRGVNLSRCTRKTLSCVKKSRGARKREPSVGRWRSDKEWINMSHRRQLQTKQQ